MHKNVQPFIILQLPKSSLEFDLNFKISVMWRFDILIYLYIL